MDKTIEELLYILHQMTSGIDTKQLLKFSRTFLAIVLGGLALLLLYSKIQTSHEKKRKESLRQIKNLMSKLNDEELKICRIRLHNLITKLNDLLITEKKENKPLPVANRTSSQDMTKVSDILTNYNEYVSKFHIEEFDQRRTLTELLHTIDLIESNRRSSRVARIQEFIVQTKTRDQECFEKYIYDDSLLIKDKAKYNIMKSLFTEMTEVSEPSDLDYANTRYLYYRVRDRLIYEHLYDSVKYYDKYFDDIKDYTLYVFDRSPKWTAPDRSALLSRILVKDEMEYCDTYFDTIFGGFVPKENYLTHIMDIAIAILENKRRLEFRAPVIRDTLLSQETISNFHPESFSGIHDYDDLEDIYKSLLMEDKIGSMDWDDFEEEYYIYMHKPVFDDLTYEKLAKQLMLDYTNPAENVAMDFDYDDCLETYGFDDDTDDPVDYYERFSAWCHRQQIREEDTEETEYMDPKGIFPSSELHRPKHESGPLYWEALMDRHELFTRFVDLKKSVQQNDK